MQASLHGTAQRRPRFYIVCVSQAGPVGAAFPPVFNDVLAQCRLPSSPLSDFLASPELVQSWLAAFRSEGRKDSCNQREWERRHQEAYNSAGSPS